jgi:hypothetical protein
MDVAERKGAAAGAEAVPGERENDGMGAVVSLGDGWDNDDGAGRRPEDEAGRGVVGVLSGDGCLGEGGH